MEIKKNLIIFIFSLLLCNTSLKYEVTLYGIPMANVDMSFNNKTYKDFEVIELFFKTSTNNIISQFFKVDNEYRTLIKNNNLDIISFEKSTYQPNVINRIKTFEENEKILYEGTNIIIPQNHFNIFSLLYYLSNTPFNEIKSEVDLEREGLIYKCLINKQINQNLYEFELQFNLINNNNLVPVVKHSDIFTWGLFRKDAKNKIIVDPTLNQIQKCVFSVGISNLEAKIKRPLNN